MTRTTSHAALWSLGSALVVIALLAVWLAHRGEDEEPVPTDVASSTTATNATPALPQLQPSPQFTIEPAALDPEQAASSTGGGAPSTPLGAVVAPLRALVVHADGTPAAGVTVVATAGEVVIDTQITGVDGAAPFSITGGRVELYVGGASPTPQHFEIEPANGEQRLELKEGAFVGGIVLLDGQPPDEPLRLVLHTNGGDPPSDVPARVFMELAQVKAFGDMRVGQQTTQGRFLFSGLPLDWNGYVGFPETLRLEEDGSQGWFPVERPAADLVLRLTWAGAVTGRVVDPLVAGEDLHPAAGAEVHFTVRESGGSRESGLVAGPDGRFRLPLLSESPTDVDLQFRADDGRGRAELRLEQLDPLVGRELGDVVLVATSRAQFRAMDEAGHPLAGAVATALDATRARSRPTDPSGIGVLPDLMPGTASLRVDALGFTPTELALSPDALASADSAPLDVVLHPAPQFELRVIASDGRPAGRVNVECQAHDELFEGENASSTDSLQVELGATRFNEINIQTSPGHTESSGQAWTDSEGRCLFTRMRAGVSFTIRVSDIYGNELRPAEQFVLAPREQRVVEWTVDGQPKAVQVSVRDRDGAPLPGVDVFLRDSQSPNTNPNWGHSSGRQATSENGELVFHDVFAARISIQAERRGYGSAWLLDQFVPAAGARFDLTLGSGRTVDIQVVGADGVPRQVDRVAMTDGLRRIEAKPAGDDGYRLEDAPEGRITLTAQLARRSYSIQHDTSQPNATIVLPKLGALNARWTVPLQDAQPYTVLVRSVGPDAWSRTGYMSNELRASGGPIEFSDLQPGDYEVVLGQGSAWSDDDPSVSQVARVQVKAGETAGVTLEP